METTRSVLSLVLYNRFVSGPFSTLKAFDRTFLRELDLNAIGVDLKAELIAKVRNQSLAQYAISTSK
jgi:hypothetical protein